MSDQVTSTSGDNVLSTAQLYGHSSPTIAIVGGGMVGASLALLLSQSLNAVTPHKPGSNTPTDSPRQPVNIILIEKQAFPSAPQLSSNAVPPITPASPSFDARSTALSAGSVNTLQTLSIWESLQEHAEAIDRIHISDRGHYGSTLLEADDYDVDALGYVVENQQLGQCLLQQLQQHDDIRCLAPATVTQCQPKKRGVVLSVVANNDEADNTTVTDYPVDMVLIADGADSPLRESLGIDQHIQPYQQSAIITNVTLTKPHQGIAYERFTHQGPLALLPLADYAGQARASIVWTRHSDQIDRLMSMDSAAFMAELQSCFGYRAGHFTHVGQRHAYPLALVQAAEQIRSHIVIMGNAAHFLHPVAGQGFNLSLRDCTTLVDILAAAHRKGEALGAYSTLLKYEQQRERDQQLTVGLTDTMVKMFSTQQIPLSVLRQLGLLSLQVLPQAKTVFAKHMMGVS